MAYKLTSAVLRLPGLSPTEKLLLSVLADFANSETGICWPSRSRLASLSGLSEQSVTRHLRRLREAGLITQEIRGRGRTPAYRILSGSTFTVSLVTPRIGKKPPREREEGSLVMGETQRVQVRTTGAHAKGEIVLNPSDRQDYQKLKQAVKDSCFSAGAALRQIRDRQLYLVEHPSFEAFCEAEYGFQRAQAYRLIEASEVKAQVEEVSPIGDMLTSESQARALAKVDPEQRVEVLAKAAESGKVTASSIAAAAQEVAPKKAKEKPVEVLDPLGHAIPQEILPHWQEAERWIRDSCQAISAIKSDIRDGMSQKSLAFRRYGTRHVAELEKVYNSLKEGKPYTVCPNCQGHKSDGNCTDCKGQGFLPKHVYETAVPAEVRCLWEAEP